MSECRIGWNNQLQRVPADGADGDGDALGSQLGHDPAGGVSALPAQLLNPDHRLGGVAVG